MPHGPIYLELNTLKHEERRGSPLWIESPSMYSLFSRVMQPRPSTFNKQLAEEAKSSSDQAVRAEDPAAQRLLGPFALPFLLRMFNQAHQGVTGLR